MEEVNIDFLNQFNSLHHTGMLDSMERLKKENKELLRIVNDSSELISLTDVDAMIEYIISKFLNYFVPENLLFLIHPPRRKHLREYFYKNLVRQDQKIYGSSFDGIRRILDSFVKQNQSGIPVGFDGFSDASNADVFSEDFLKLRPELIIPMVGIGGVYGIVVVSNKITGASYTQSELTYMNKMFSVLSITIQNGLHYETSITDPKTGLYTNDFFFSRVNEMLSSVHRYKSCAGMLIIDIDFFKKFNDTWGHLVGDKVLIALANCLKKNVRNEDCVARFGGEEFSVLLTQCTPESIRQVAERIRVEIERIILMEQDKILSITASIGGCVIQDYPGLTAKLIFRKADQALYHSKETGRNKTTIYKMGLLDLARMRRRDYDESELN